MPGRSGIVLLSRLNKYGVQGATVTNRVGRGKCSSCSVSYKISRRRDVVSFQSTKLPTHETVIAPKDHGCAFR